MKKVNNNILLTKLFMNKPLLIITKNKYMQMLILKTSINRLYLAYMLYIKLIKL